MPAGPHLLAPTRVALDPNEVIADVDPRVFGGLMEHMGRCVYEGVYDPASRFADEHGCRTDVLDALGRLDMTAVRYPGGNFVSGYDWRDGIGPKAQRVERLERAWRCVEPNTFGTDEFLPLCERMGWTPMMAVNLGTGRARQAQELVAYTNSADTPMAELRAGNGQERPWSVGLWCLGNEMDGVWQIGHCSASEYARRARDAAAAMRDVDPAIEVVGCGSADPNLPSHPRWSITLLDEFGDGLDYISVHRYARNFFRRTPDFLGFGLAVDAQIEEIAALCKQAQQRHGHDRRTQISFDEWNVWYKTAAQPVTDRFRRAHTAGVAPALIEEIYNLEDALVCAGFLNSFIRHADVVRIANLAQMVNVIAPLITKRDRLLVQSIFHVFRMFSARRTGDALAVTPQGPTYRTRRFGEVPVVDLSAICGPDQLHVFAVNRSLDAVAPLQIDLTNGTFIASPDAEILTGPAPRAHNTFQHPDVVTAQPFAEASSSGCSVELPLPPLSLVAVSIPMSRGV